MEPEVRYCTTDDGVRIAYTVTGSGPSLVWVGDLTLGSHVQREWRLPVFRELFSGLISRRTLIRFDSRGLGLSDRNVADVSLEARVRDLEAVVDKLMLTDFVLVGDGWGSLSSVTYAVRHPERVSHLILQDCTVKISTALAVPSSRVLGKLLASDWEMFTENVGSLEFGWGAPQAREYGEFIRASVTQESAWRNFAALAEVDLNHLLPSIEVPTLVVGHTAVRSAPVDMARELAALIPDARLRIIEGHWGDNVHDVLGVIGDFLGDEYERHPPAVLPSGMTAILFADIADSTALTERLGDAAFRAKARELGGAVRAVIRECAGTPVEGPTLGDGVLAVFKSAREAIGAARLCAKAGDDAGLPLHLGLHAGDVSHEKDPDGRSNVYGGAVNVAARISGLSAAGEVLVSETVRSLARTSAGVAFEDRGEQALKGVGEPVRVWAVVEGE